MLLIELFQNLSELRRNPAQNEKLSGHLAAVKFLKGKDLKNYGVSMTSLPKLGINPGSDYNTPLGIYFYPADYYMKIKGGDKPTKLPFVDDAAYIQIFELLGNIEDIDNLDVSKYNSYVSKLYANIDKVAKLIGQSENNTHKKMANALMSAGTQSNVKTYGGQLWYVMYMLSRLEEVDPDGYSADGKRGAAAPRSSVIWNSLLRILGLSGVIDNGEGIIHQNEPYAGVIADPRSIKHLETIRNIQNTNPADNATDNIVPPSEHNSED